MQGSSKAILTATGLAVLVIAGSSAYYYSHPVLQAKHRLRQYVRAGQHGDMEKFCRYSLIEQNAPLFAKITADDDESDVRTLDERAADEISEMLETMSSVRSIEIGKGSRCLSEIQDTTALLRRNRVNEKKIMERAGIEPDPEYEAVSNEYLSMRDSLQDAYDFEVTVCYPESSEPETEHIEVVQVGGVWKVDPVSSIILIPVVNDPDEKKTKQKDNEEDEYYDS